MLEVLGDLENARDKRLQEALDAVSYSTRHGDNVYHGQDQTYKVEGTNNKTAQGQHLEGNFTFH